MEYSEWKSLPLGTEGRTRDLLHTIGLNGKKAERLIRKMERNSNFTGREDYTLDVQSISKVLKCFYKMLNSYQSLVSTIMYEKLGGEEFEDRYQEFINEFKSLSERLSFEKQVAAERGGFDELSMPSFYNEMRFIMQRIYIPLNQAKEHSLDFEEAIPRTIRLTSGMLPENDDGSLTQRSPTPDHILQEQMHEEQDEHAEVEDVQDSIEDIEGPDEPLRGGDNAAEIFQLAAESEGL